MRRRHATSPRFSGHYHDLGMPSLINGHDSACDCILSVGRGRRTYRAAARVAVAPHPAVGRRQGWQTRPRHPRALRVRDYAGDPAHDSTSRFDQMIAQIPTCTWGQILSDLTAPTLTIARSVMLFCTQRGCFDPARGRYPGPIPVLVRVHRVRGLEPPRTLTLESGMMNEQRSSYYDGTNHAENKTAVRIIPFLVLVFLGVNTAICAGAISPVFSGHYRGLHILS